MAAGQEAWLVGTGLGAAGATRLILTGPYPGDSQRDVTTWLVPPSQPPPAVRRAIRLPATTGDPPAGAPRPADTTCGWRSPRPGARVRSAQQRCR